MHLNVANEISLLVLITGCLTQAKLLCSHVQVQFFSNHFKTHFKQLTCTPCDIEFAHFSTTSFHKWNLDDLNKF